MASKNELIIDFLVNLKSDPNQVNKFVTDLESKAKSLNIGINTEQAKAAVGQMVNSFTALETAAKGIGDSLNKGLGKIDLSQFTNQLSGDKLAGLQTQLDAVFNVKSGSGLHKDLLEVGNDMLKIKTEAQSLAVQQQQALTVLANSGHAGSEAYKQLEVELKKTESLVAVVDKNLGTGIGNKLGDGVKKGFLEKLHPQELMTGVLSVFGGVGLMSGVQGIVGGFEQVLEAGKGAFERTEQLDLAFKQAGLSGEGLEKQMARTSSFASKLSNEFAVSAGKVKDYASTAAAIGGATGKANEDVVTLAIGIEKLSKGTIDGNMVMRTFTKGLNDPEAVAGLGRLTMRFPQLATALKGIKDPAEMTAAAMKMLSPTFNTLREQAQGPLGSFERLQNSLNALKSKLGVSMIEVAAPLMEVIGTTVVPAIQGLASGIGTAFKVINDNKQYVIAATSVLTAFAAASWLSHGGLVRLGTTAAEAGKNILTKLVPSLFTQTAAQEGATAAQYKFNLASMANPYVIAVASIVGLIAALKLLSDALHVSAQEKLDAARAEEEVVKSQMESVESQKSVVENNLKLVESFRTQGAAAMENADTMNKLAEAYPGVVSSTKSYEENLKALEEAAKNSHKELGNLDNQLTDLTKQSLDLKRMELSLDVQVKKEDLENQLTDEFNKINWKTLGDKGAVAFGDKVSEWFNLGSGGRGAAENMMKSFTDGVQNAKSSAEIDKAGFEMRSKIFASKDLDNNAKQAAAKQVQAYVDSAKKALEASKDKINNDVATMLSMGKSDEEITKMLAKMYGKSKEEIQGMINKQRESKGVTQEQVSGVEALASAWNKAKSDATKAMNDNLAGMADLLKKGKANWTDEDKKNFDDYKNKAKSGYKEITDASKLELQAKKEAGIQEKATTEQANKALQIADKMFAQHQAQAKLNQETRDLNREISLIEQGRQKNAYDDLAIQKEKIQSLEDEKGKFQEVYGKILKINEAGQVEILPGIKLKPEEIEKLKTSWQSVMTNLQKENVKELEIKAKLKIDNAEIAKNLAEFNKQQLEFDISIGLKPQSNMTDLLKSELTDIESKLGDTKLKLQTVIEQPDTLENQAAIAELNKSIIASQKDKLAKIKEISASEKAVYDEQTNTIKDNLAKQQKAIDDYYSKMEAQITHFSDTWVAAKQLIADADKKSSTERLAVEEKKAQDDIQRLQDLGTISKESAEKKKTEISKKYQAQREKEEKESADRIRVISDLAAGAKLENDRQKALASAKIQQKGIEDEITILQKMKFDQGDKFSLFDQKKLDDLSKQLEGADAIVSEKGDILSSNILGLNTAFGDMFTNMFAGMDAEKSLQPLKEYFIKMSGVLITALSDWLSKVILEATFALFSAEVEENPLLAAVLFAPTYALISAGAHAIADPILNKLSFATGGRIDQPTTFLAGDASRLGGINREWIFRDDQLKATVMMASLGANNALIEEIRSLKSLMASQEIDAVIKGTDIRLSQRRTAHNISQRAR